MPLRSTFCKEERLKREQHIETLFRSGKAFSAFPLRLIWMAQQRGPEHYPARAGFSVPKRKFKHAVDRNRLKRLMREAWRLQKFQLYETIPREVQLHVFLIYTDARIADFETIQAAVAQGIGQLLRVACVGGPVSEPAQQTNS